MQDIALVTIDCWRHDAPERMPNLAAAETVTERRDALCQSAATRGAFPALLSGLYYPQAYSGFDAVADGVRSLPEVLADAGYATCGIVGSNPFLSTWAPAFDRFWNDGMTTDGDQSALGERLQAGASTLRHAANYLRLRSRVPATDVAARAREWYESQEGPRFVWLHLMDVHVPFFPGLARGLSTGLLDAYRAHYRFMDDPHSLTDAEYETLEELYWQSVAALDEQLPEVLAFLDDDAHVAIVGDHGEEFRHDEWGHARLYDECTRVPFLASESLAASLGDGEHLRQLDVPATLLDAVGLDVPDEWEGGPAREADPYPAFAINHSPQFGELYAAVRGERYKLLRTFDAETGRLQRTEAYDMDADPGETTDLSGSAELSALESELDAFLAREAIEGNLREDERDVSAKVEDRLQALGYK
ncbi:MAG: sulfatase-like hydrolase/transferase [Haloarculaceae archaeon]